MANEALNSVGAYTTIVAAASIATTAFSTAGNATAIGAAIAAEDLYPQLDLQVTVSAGTVTAGDIVNIYRRPSDGTTQAPIPANTSQHTKRDWVGSVILVSNAESRYLIGVRNHDPADTYYLENTGAATMTLGMKARGSSYGTA